MEFLMLSTSPPKPWQPEIQYLKTMSMQSQEKKRPLSISLSLSLSLSLSHRSFHSNFLVITILAVPSIINYTLPSFIFSGVKFEVYEFAVYPNLGTKPGYQMRGSGSMKPFFLENKKDKKTK